MLQELRMKLEQVNSQLFRLLDSRLEIVEQIQTEKSISWDPTREIKVFQDYVKQHPHQDLKSDLIYSLLIETQAQNFGYPRWSEGDHLKSQVTSGISHMINPILLRIRNESEYATLDLIDDYDKLIEGVWENQKLLQ